METFGIYILLSKLMTIFSCLLEQGLDIVGVQTVINFACPRDYKRFTTHTSLLLIVTNTSLLPDYLSEFSIIDLSTIFSQCVWL